MAIITLTTDFGMVDSYVGTMKGVILGIASEAKLVDLSHEIPPQDIRSGAFALKVAHPYFPSGTVHLVVVDPGVGSDRRVLIVETKRAIFVGPDNGVLSWALEEEDISAVVQATQPAYWLEVVSRTFHGRDIFAPLAAHLAQGIPVHRFGVSITDPIRLPLPQPYQEPQDVVASEVIYIDRFGNLITSIRVDSQNRRITNLPDASGDLFLSRESRVMILDRFIEGIEDSYANVMPGELLALIGSSGHLEVAVRDGNAASALNAHIGAVVRVSPA